MRKFFVLLVVFSLSPAWGAEPIGKVVDLVGESWITHTDTKASVAFLNREIYSGDRVKTTKNGAVKILFIDDTLLTVKEDSSVFISEFLFNAKEKQRKVAFNATYGRIRALIGRFFGKDQPVEINTPTAVAGIRGTDIGVSSNVKSSTFYCFICEEAVLSVYNIHFPDNQVSLASGQSIEISERKAALQESISLIPEDVLDKKEILFDIQKGETAKAIEATTTATTRETSGEVVAVKESVMEETILDQTENIAAEENLTASNPGTVDTGGTETNPGGTQQNSEVHITLTLPGS